METILQVIQIVISILLMITILVQNKTEGFNAATMSSASPIQTQKRGAEKVLFNATIVLAVLFVLASLSFIFV
ncbi:preprotein translocase subunit SecG [Candidatus Peregrinibacteria bacterium]|nr:preprotein translocase subunit SecG [Candidatus Peregrinibacteria bacterium]